MTEHERRPGYLWDVMQEWLDSIPYPPSQRKLAKRLGVSPTLVTDWKYGDVMPSPEMVQALAAEMGVPYERVLDAALKDQGYRLPPQEAREVRRA